MNFLDIAKRRYTTKRYTNNEKIEEDKINTLKHILRLSPSSINSQPWKFIFVSDDETKKKLADASFWNAEKINEASHLVVFSCIDDVELFEKQIQESLPEAYVAYYDTFLKPKGDTEIKSWLQHQVYLSLGFFLAASASLEIDSTPMEGVEYDKYNQILELQGYKTLFCVALGYRNPTDSNQPAQRPKSRSPFDNVIKSI
jgi:nitroreductase/dihydropteridine reductase